jgi:glycosyltransferase involved in cell wall biosynthesis
MYPFPKISIVIPSFNKAKFIGKTLESIVSQDYGNFEVIIMDGGSSDGTLKIIKEYAKKYPNLIRYQSKKDRGQWDALNKGFAKAKGDILGFINADDVYKKGAFKEIVRLYKLNPEELWFAGRGGVINTKGDCIALLPTIYKNFLLSLNMRFFLLITNYLMQPSVFITKKAWRSFGPFVGVGRFVMEYNTWLKISKQKMPVVTDKSISSFRMGGENASSTSFDKLLEADEKIVEKETKNAFILFLHRLHNLGRRKLVKKLK